MKHTKLMSAVYGLALAGTVAVTATVNAQAAEMVKFKIVDEAIPVSLTGKPGDPVEGRKIAINRKLGNCLACHVMPIPEQPFHGNTGPSLFGIGDRSDGATLRMRLVDAKVINPDTLMPSFYKTGQVRVLKQFQGKTILNEQQIEDVVAYLLTLK